MSNKAKKARNFAALSGTALVAAPLMTSGVASADAYTVTNLAASGDGSLLKAIEDANSHPGADTITGGSGVNDYLYGSTNDSSLRAMDIITNLSKLGKKVLNESTIILYPRTPDKTKQYDELVVKTLYLTTIEAKKAVLVDVREKSEWDKGHSEGAIFLPLSELQAGVEPKSLAEADVSQIKPEELDRAPTIICAADSVTLTMTLTQVLRDAAWARVA